MFLQPDPLPVGQRQQSVVVHHRVHVLHPQGVHVAVEQDVLALVLVGGAVDLAEDVGEEAVGPVAGDRVQDAVELDDAHGLGVHHVQLGVDAESGRTKFKDGIQMVNVTRFCIR